MIRLFSIYLIIFPFLSFAQQKMDTLDVDNAFARARNMAFNGKKTESIRLCQRILRKSPTYEEVRVFMGRVFIWNDQKDSARYTLRIALKNEPTNLEALSALADLEYWSDNPKLSIAYSNKALTLKPGAEEFLIKKAKAVADTGNYKGAYNILQELLKKNPNNSDVRQLAQRYRELAAKNRIGLSYTFDYFDKRFKEPWHFASLNYTRATKAGSLVLRYNRINRFSTNGNQGEIDFYPSLGRKMYAYLNFGVADASYLPQYRIGVSIYRNLPKAFEVEVGVRYLKFDEETFIYTGSIGKYIGSYWFSLRPTFVPSSSEAFSQSLAFITRYYFDTSNDFLSLTIASGFSPDERSRESVISQNAVQQTTFKSYRINFGFQRLIEKKYLIGLAVTWLNEDFSVGTSIENGTNYTIAVSLDRIF